MTDTPPPPCYSEHPSVLIQEEMAARGWDRDRMTWETYPPSRDEWSIRRVALDLYLEVGADMPEMRLGEMADHYATAFGVSAALFRNLETAWLTSIARQPAKASRR